MTRLSIFDIPLIVDSICDNLSADDIFNCRNTSKDFHKAFLGPHMRDITIGIEVFEDDRKVIEKYASRIQTLTLDYSEDNIEATYLLEDSILPVFPALTHLTRLDIKLDVSFNPELLHGILNSLPDSLRILELDYEYYFDEDWKSLSITWKPNKLERICLRGEDESKNEDLYLIPLIKASPELQALRIPSVSSGHVEDFMKALGQSCPKLRYLVLNKNKIPYSYGSEAFLFHYIQQPLKMLRIDLALDKYSMNVFSTILKHSANSIQEIRLHNIDGLEFDSLEQLVDECPNLECLYYRDNYSFTSSNMMTGKGYCH
ncbi:hypothetical protein BGZ95_010376 [Linnemannia exigua]|uniref:F-box domain-containing protein n=1 Tax=Linnemannia exigua TaxID=604196 RepID=A0AAD4HAT5_9FUNG|nr:hypothetical protein BGZ95_010376 [Linnemannia exigua]